MNYLHMVKTDKVKQNDSLPEGYSFVTHKKKYTEKWLELSELLGKRWTEEAFEKDMLGGIGIYPEGIFYILDDNSEVVATASGIVGEDKTGTLHMISMCDKCRGKGMGTVLCSRVVNYLLDMGMKKITLMTNDFRIPAIKIYLNLKFLPVLKTGDNVSLESWKSVASALNCTVLPAIVDNEYIDNIL